MSMYTYCKLLYLFLCFAKQAFQQEPSISQAHVNLDEDRVQNEARSSPTVQLNLNHSGPHIIEQSHYSTDRTQCSRQYTPGEVIQQYSTLPTDFSDSEHSTQHYKTERKTTNELDDTTVTLIEAVSKLQSQFQYFQGIQEQEHQICYNNNLTKLSNLHNSLDGQDKNRFVELCSKLECAVKNNVHGNDIDLFLVEKVVEGSGKRVSKLIEISVNHDLLMCRPHTTPDTNTIVSESLTQSGNLDYLKIPLRRQNAFRAAYDYTQSQSFSTSYDDDSDLLDLCK